MKLPAETWTNVYARLTTSGALRQLARENPAKAAAALGIDPDQAPALAEFDLAGLDNQAATLIGKRWHEVRKYLPRTTGDLGRAAKRAFENYVETFWPEGHRRHLLDAAAFVHHLELRWPNRIDPIERNRIRFQTGRKRFRIWWGNLAVHGSPARPGLHFLGNFRGRLIEQFTYFDVGRLMPAIWRRRRPAPGSGVVSNVASAAG